MRVNTISFSVIGDENVDVDKKIQEPDDIAKLKERKSFSSFTSSVMQITASTNEDGLGAVAWWVE